MAAGEQYRLGAGLSCRRAWSAFVLTDKCWVRLFWRAVSCALLNKLDVSVNRRKKGDDVAVHTMKTYRGSWGGWGYLLIPNMANRWKWRWMVTSRHEPPDALRKCLGTHRKGGCVGRRNIVPGFGPRLFQASIYHQLLFLILYNRILPMAFDTGFHTLEFSGRCVLTLTRWWGQYAFPKC